MVNLVICLNMNYRFFEKGYRGVNIYPLRKYNKSLARLYLDHQRHFEYQHPSKNSFESVNFSVIQLVSNAIAVLINFTEKYRYE